MLNEPHYPSKWSVVGVLLIIILLIGSVFAWAFWLNRGTVLVTSSQGFQLDAGGTEYDCAQGSCELSLAPGVVEFRVRADGYFDQSFVLEVVRWAEQRKEVELELVPYLKDVVAGDVPNEVFGPVGIQPRGKWQELLVDGQVITRFESLVEPQVSSGGDWAVIVDEGRVFFVNIPEGRKTRRFDDSVQIESALVSEGGERVLLFGVTRGVKQLWLWYTQTSQLTTLEWYEPVELVQWRPGHEHRLFVITDQLEDETDSLFDEVVDSAQDLNNPRLFQLNLDTGVAQQIGTFGLDKAATALLERSGRFFVEFSDGSYQELVIK